MGWSSNQPGNFSYDLSAALVQSGILAFVTLIFQKKLEVIIRPKCLGHSKVKISKILCGRDSAKGFLENSGHRVLIDFIVVLCFT
jgi:hypothetical protein